LITTATRLDAYHLMHHGIIALEKVEHNGIAIDVGYAEAQFKTLGSRIKETQTKLESTTVVKKWKAEYGSDFLWDSNEQLADVLFNKMDYKPARLTKTGQPSTDEASLSALRLPMMKGLIRLRKMEKTRNTYLASILREVVEGFVHPIFKLHSVRTYRSSCSNPNFQNMPIRDPIMGKIIRRCIIPRPGRQIVEIDFSGLEVRIAACYHKDPNMLAYIEDPTKDMHRDMAGECFMLPPVEVTKDARYCGKNMFVFPEFYGDYHVRCAANLWDAIPKMKLATVSGTPMKDHLRSEDIRGLPSFTRHIKAVEKDFWGRRFRVYDQWKRDHYNRYLRNGSFDMLTGFRVSGVLSRNDVINYPVQGAAFHCLLWCLTELQKWLEEEGMESLIIGQIHDSIVMDVVPEEMEAVLAKAQDLMTRAIREHWDWIVAPLEIEAEVAPVDASWWDKKEVKLEAA